MIKQQANLTNATLPGVSIVVIGRNEGERLRRCLESIAELNYPTELIELIYVDTDSTDDSRAVAESAGARVVHIQPQQPTAAAARNAGLHAAKSDLIHFFDGDTVVHPDWLRKAVAVLHDDAVHAVYGRREEAHPRATWYNFCIHHDWYVPPGRVDTCGGDVMFRRADLLAVGGYDASLIAGEERDLCCRLIAKRSVGIVRLDDPMTQHDINMTRFSQYWRRCFRSGYAYAQVAARYSSLARWRKTCAKNLAHVALLLAVVAASVALTSLIPLAIWIVCILILVARDTATVHSQVRSWRDAFLYAVHHYVAKLPTVLGHLAYYRRHLIGGAPQSLVEYRDAT